MSERKSWRMRAPEIATLYNPAFCAAMIHPLSTGYRTVTGKGFPFTSTYIALPMLLHPASMEVLPSTSRTNLHGWILEHPHVVIGFPERASALVPFVREALVFGLKHNIFTINGSLIQPCTNKRIKGWESDTYNSRFANDAKLLGKLLGQLTDEATLFALFGVRP